MSTGLAVWIETASAGDLVDGLELLARELRQRQNGVTESTVDADLDSRPLTVREAAALVGVSTGRIYSLVKTGHIAGAIRVGKRQVRFNRSGLEAWIRNGGEAQE